MVWGGRRPRRRRRPGQPLRKDLKRTSGDVFQNTSPRRMHQEHSLRSKETMKEGKTSYEVDFSYLREYENVHFILCLRPNANSNDFELILPTEKKGQLYKNLDLRHRNALEILKFLRFYSQIPWGQTSRLTQCNLFLLLSAGSVYFLVLHSLIGCIFCLY